MAQPVSSKEANAVLNSPFSEPEPAAETGLNAHFGSTMAGINTSDSSTHTGRSNLLSNNPYSKIHGKSDSGPTTPPKKNKAREETHVRNVSGSSNRSKQGSPREGFPTYRAEAFGDFNDSPRRREGSSASRGSRQATPPSYDEAIGGPSTRPRRTSSLTARYPGDRSHEPLNIIRRDSRKADKSPHLKKRHLPGADRIDRLDPAVGGATYHHEGPYDAALLARNSSFESAPIAALEESNREALKATPAERIKDSLDKHIPLDGVAAIPPGVPDRLGRTYNYEEGTDMMREGVTDAGYKRWADKEYDPDDLKGQSEPSYSLDRALRAHKIDDNGIEMEDRAGISRDCHKAERKGLLDSRDPVAIAGDDAKYTDLQRANDTDAHAAPRRSGSLRHGVEGLKKRVGNAVHRRQGSRDD
ncbi:hypothetical protein K431DRAFT_283112 [Polychaeton citri CBS 116435]|uniref:Pal1-domain-containing protein n=1 Tax=Polychaeton citri CBS 116435 TaxID=1314669 RepID=A0A9P4QED5_9PEZI|nr:hypothetical protein K431DRAFT_283112 [Polychaeton citri CBS 116435]